MNAIRCRKTLLAAALLCAGAAAQAQQVKLMTGPQGGSWYPLGGAIANIADKAGMKVQVLPGAGIANVKAIEAGKADLGFANSISTVDGVAGRAPFDKPAKNVCNVATLYPQYYQVVANADAEINSLGDLKGKSLAVQPKGNTAEFISQQSLEVYGLEYKDMSRVSYVSYTDAVSLMKDNNAQAFTLGTTVPASAIMDLASARDIKLIADSRRQVPGDAQAEPRLYQADDSGQQLSEADQGRADDRLCDARDRALRPRRERRLQGAEGHGRQQGRPGRDRQGHGQGDAEDDGRGYRRAAAQGRGALLQGSRRDLNRAALPEPPPASGDRGASAVIARAGAAGAGAYRCRRFPRIVTRRI